MAMIVCPECKKEISDKANACPHCGCPNSNAKANNTKDITEILRTFPDVVQKYQVNAFDLCIRYLNEIVALPCSVGKYSLVIQ